jgi:integrase/recombinase XerD
MSPSTQTPNELRQRMVEDMRMRKLFFKTQSSYIRAMRRFAGNLGRSPDTASAEDLRIYPRRPAASYRARQDGISTASD